MDACGIGDQVPDSLGNQGTLALHGGIDVSLAIRGVVLLLVAGPAEAAIVVALPFGFSTPRELLNWLVSLATPTSPQQTRTDVPIHGSA
jgi:hypothetical protein